MTGSEMFWIGPGEISASKMVEPFNEKPDKSAAGDFWFRATLTRPIPPNPKDNRSEYDTKKEQFAPKCGQCSNCKESANQRCINQGFADKVGVLNFRRTL